MGTSSALVAPQHREEQHREENMPIGNNDDVSRRFLAVSEAICTPPPLSQTQKPPPVTVSIAQVGDTAARKRRAPLHDPPAESARLRGWWCAAAGAATACWSTASPPRETGSESEKQVTNGPLNAFRLRQPVLSARVPSTRGHQRREDASASLASSGRPRTARRTQP